MEPLPTTFRKYTKHVLKVLPVHTLSPLSPFPLFVNWLIVNSRLVYLVRKGMRLVTAGIIALYGGEGWKEERVEETGKLGGSSL